MMFSQASMLFLAGLMTCFLYFASKVDFVLQPFLDIQKITTIIPNDNKGCKEMLFNHLDTSLKLQESVHKSPSKQAKTVLEGMEMIEILNEQYSIASNFLIKLYNRAPDVDVATLKISVFNPLVVIDTKNNFDTYYLPLEVTIIFKVCFFLCCIHILTFSYLIMFISIQFIHSIFVN